MSILADFKKFLLRRNLVELAVAFVMGVVFAALLKAFIADLITPIIRSSSASPSSESCRSRSTAAISPTATSSTTCSRS